MVSVLQQEYDYKIIIQKVMIKPLGVTFEQVVLSYIFVKLFYIDCIIVIKGPDDGHISDRNVLFLQ